MEHACGGILEFRSIVSYTQGLQSRPHHVYFSLSLRDYSLAHDTYAFGVILWEILTLQVPWSSGEDESYGKRGRSQMKLIETMNRVRGRGESKGDAKIQLSQVSTGMRLLLHR